MLKKAPARARNNLKAAGRAMDDAEHLLRVPQTDRKTIAAETEVIERLAAGAGQVGGSAQAQAAMMAFMQQLMQQLGMDAGSQPGQGSMAGGGTDVPDGGDSGVASTDDADGRTTSGSAGLNPAEFPPEFRDALQGYLREVERYEE